MRNYGNPDLVMPYREDKGIVVEQALDRIGLARRSTVVEQGLHRKSLGKSVNRTETELEAEEKTAFEQNRNFSEEIERPERDKLRAPRNTRDERARKIGEALSYQKEKDDKQQGLPWRR